MKPETFSSQNLPSILIVDDDSTNLELLAGMLRRQGYEPRPVSRGKMALLAAQTDPPDLILLDIGMPEMNGFEVCERLKADEALQDIPVIFITALTDTADKVKAFSLGAVDYVTKPFQFDDVKARVDTHLKIRFLQRQIHAQNENLEQLLAERTRKLVKTYERLVELDRIKDDFLRMISHEIRTPANGVLGIGGLLLDICPDSEESLRYKELFVESGLRLRNLIEDATMIANIEKLSRQSGAPTRFSNLLADVQASHPEIQISIGPPAALEPVLLRGDYTLLRRALETIILLATAFSLNKHTAHATTKVEANLLRIHFNLNALPLSMEAVEGFFAIESLARAESSAETLGLAPVVGYRIITAFGGEMKLVKGKDKTGYLEATFIKEGADVQRE